MNVVKNKIIFATLFIVFLFINYAYASMNVGREKYYAVYWSDKLIGYSHYFVSQRVYLGEKEYFRINSDCQLKVGMGNIENVQFITDTFIDRKTYLPSTLNLLQETKGTKLNIHSVFSKSLIIQKNFFNDKGSEYMETVKTPPVVFINNFWGSFNSFPDQFELLAFMMKDEKETSFLFYDPLLKSIDNVIVVKGEEEKVSVRNKEYNCIGYKILAPNKEEIYRFYIENKQMYLVKAIEVNGAISMMISNANIVNETSKIKGIDLWDLRTTNSGFILPNAPELDFLKVKISGKIFGEMIKDFKEQGFRQKYYTEKNDKNNKSSEINVEEEISAIINEDKVQSNKTLSNIQTEEKTEKDAKTTEFDGIIEVKTNDIVLSNSFKYPITENFSDDIKKYLQNEFGMEVNDKAIKEKTAFIALSGRTAKAVIEQVLNFIKEEIKIGPATPSARLTFDLKQGNSQTISMLAVTMLRSVGIPSRIIGGLIYSSGNFVPHYWVECYAAPNKWISVDPSLGEVEKISAAHIALWHKGDIENPKIKILDFAPNPATPVPYFRTEVKWPMGEERKYKIIKDEQEIAEEIVSLKEIAILGEKEVFSFDSSINITEPSAKSVIKANYSLDPYLLPVWYKIEAAGGKEKFTEEYNFNKNFVTKTVKYNGNNPKEISMPVSPGAYLADKRVLSQICAALGQMPEIKPDKVYKIFLFLPDSLKTEEISLKINNVEYMDVNGRKTLAFIASGDKLNAWIDKDGRVLKVDFPEQNITYMLDSYKNILSK